MGTTIFHYSDQVISSAAMSRQNSIRLSVTDDVNRIEAPVTWKAYLMCAFASFGGIFFGYDSGYINGVLGSELFVHKVEGPTADALSSSHQSLVVSILSAGTFFGALIAGDMADMIGRKWTVIFGCLIYMIGVIIQMITGAGNALAAIVTGRLVAGIGVGFESAIVILYMSEICPRKVRGALVAGYQFCITIGIMLASIVVYATEDRTDTGAYRIPIAIQFAWALILAGGLMTLPDSPRYFVKRGRLEQATIALSKLRGQPRDSEYVQIELTTYYFGHFLADDATMDWCQLHLLLLHPFPTVYRSHRQHIPHFAHLHPGQRMLHTIVILDCREIRSPDHPLLGCSRHVDMPIPCRHHWCDRWLQLHPPRSHQSGPQLGRQHLGRQRTDRIHRHLHLLLCIYLGSWSLDRDRRDLPSADSLPRRRLVDRIELVVEHDHCRHHSVYGRRTARQPQVFRLLRVGWTLHLRIRLHLLPRPGDQVSYS